MRKLKEVEKLTRIELYAELKRINLKHSRKMEEKRQNRKRR